VRDSSEPQIAHRARGYTRKDGGFELLDQHPLNHIVARAASTPRWRTWRAGTARSRRESGAPLDLEAAWSRSTHLGRALPLRIRLAARSPRRTRPSRLPRRRLVGFSTFIVRYRSAGSPSSCCRIWTSSTVKSSPAGSPTSLSVELITDATVVDGTGESRFTPISASRAPDRRGRRLEPAAGEPVVDAAAWHSRRASSTATATTTTPSSILGDAVAAVSQGITTTVVGQDGDSRLPLRDFFTRLEADHRPSTSPRTPATAPSGRG